MCGVDRYTYRFCRRSGRLQLRSPIARHFSHAASTRHTRVPYSRRGIACSLIDCSTRLRRTDGAESHRCLVHPGGNHPGGEKRVMKGITTRERRKGDRRRGVWWEWRRGSFAQDRGCCLLQAGLGMARRGRVRGQGGSFTRPVAAPTHSPPPPKDTEARFVGVETTMMRSSVRSR